MQLSHSGPASRSALYRRLGISVSSASTERLRVAVAARAGASADRKVWALDATPSEQAQGDRHKATGGRQQRCGQAGRRSALCPAGRQPRPKRPRLSAVRTDLKVCPYTGAAALLTAGDVGREPVSSGNRPWDRRQAPGDRPWAVTRRPYARNPGKRSVEHSPTGRALCGSGLGERHASLSRHELSIVTRCRDTPEGVSEAAKPPKTTRTEVELRSTGQAQGQASGTRHKRCRRQRTGAGRGLRPSVREEMS
jgi:hypothetical protein